MHRRETQRELVGEDHRGTARQREPEREHLLLTAGQQRDSAVEVRLELREQLDDRVRRRAEDPDVLGDGHPHEHGLASVTSARPARARWCSGALVCRDRGSHRAAERRELAGQREDRRRLAGAVRSEQRDDLARANLEVDVADDVDVAVAGDEALGRERARVMTTARRSAAARLVGARRSIGSPRYASITSGIGLDLCGRPSAILLPEVERDDAIARLEDQRDVVLDDDDRRRRGARRSAG